VKHMCKDLGFIAQTADEAQARVPMGSRVRELYEEARAAGLADEDFSAIKKIFEA
jgi:3-hydroxyisobutyrate dehydrogenase-like beta-hydroxyacid dehydrogenase